MEENKFLVKIESGIQTPSVENSNAIYEAIMTQVENGAVEPLLALAQLKCIADGIDQAARYIREVNAVEAMNAEDKQTVKYYGCKFTIKEVGTKYNYSGDDEYDALKEEEKVLKAKIKAREVVLQAEGKYEKTSTTSVSVSLG